MWYGMRFKKVDDATSDALDHVKKLPIVPANKAFWKRPGDPELAATRVGFQEPEHGRPKVFIAQDRKAHTIEDVPTDKLIAQQPTVLRSKVVDNLLNPRGNKPEDLPEIHRAPDGRHFVEDGHHRLAAAMMRGDKITRAKVYHWANNKQGGIGQIHPEPVKKA